MAEQSKHNIAYGGDPAVNVPAAPRMLETVLDRVSDGVVVTDAEFRPIYRNKAFAALDLPADFCHPDLPCRFFAGIPQSGHNIDETGLEAKLQSGEDISLIRGHHDSKGQVHWCQLDVTGCQLDTGGSGYVATFRDITDSLEQAHQLRQAVRNLQELSLVDAQTGLHNRRWFASHLYRYWHEAMREIRPLTMLLIEVDQESITRQNNRQLLDDLMYRVAYTLNCVLKRASDVLARYDEQRFILLTNTVTQDQIEDLLLLINREVAGMKVPRDQESLQCTVSIGAAHGVPHSGSTSESMLKLTEQAVIEAASAGGDCYRFYTM